MHQVSQQQEELLTIQQITKMLHVSRPTVYAMMAREGLPFLKIGRSLRFLAPSVHAWLAEREQIRRGA